MAIPSVSEEKITPFTLTDKLVGYSAFVIMGFIIIFALVNLFSLVESGANKVNQTISKIIQAHNSTVNLISKTRCNESPPKNVE